MQAMKSKPVKQPRLVGIQKQGARVGSYVDHHEESMDPRATWSSPFYKDFIGYAMDDCSGKGGISGGLLSKEGSGLVFRDAAKNRDPHAHFSNSIGCGGSVNSPKDVQKGGSGKDKSLRPCHRSSSSGKEVTGTSSMAYSDISNPRKFLKEQKQTLSSHSETDSSETSSLQDEPGVLEITPHPEKMQRGLQAVSEITRSSNTIVLEVGSSSVVSRKRSNYFNQRNGLQNRDTVEMAHAGISGYGLRNLRCNSTSDVFPPGCSSSDSNLNKRKNIIKKVNYEGESSSAGRGKKMIGSTWKGRNVSSKNGISITESRRSKNTPPNRDNMATSLRTQAVNTGRTRARISNQWNENSVSLNSEPCMISPNHPNNLRSAALSLQVSLNAPIGLPGLSREGAISSTSPVELDITRIGRDNIRRHNMDGIAEVLLVLERIEQGEELTHEQILVLETNLLLNNLTFHDQHRDLRLDIDNMSYEQLLALEERMGTVNTALTEEALAESLKKSVYQSELSNDEIEGCHQDEDDSKCNICQEEYMMGDEVGSLQCEHRYHVDCIQQWLRLKNWCPTCKASAAPSESAPLS